MTLQKMYPSLFALWPFHHSPAHCTFLNHVIVWWSGSVWSQDPNSLECVCLMRIKGKTTPCTRADFLMDSVDTVKLNFNFFFLYNNCFPFWSPAASVQKHSVFTLWNAVCSSTLFIEVFLWVLWFSTLVQNLNISKFQFNLESVLN